MAEALLLGKPFCCQTARLKHMWVSDSCAMAYC